MADNAKLTEDLKLAGESGLLNKSNSWPDNAKLREDLKLAGERLTEHTRQFMVRNAKTQEGLEVGERTRLRWPPTVPHAHVKGAVARVCVRERESPNPP